MQPATPTASQGDFISTDTPYTLLPEKNKSEDGDCTVTAPSTLSLSTPPSDQEDNRVLNHGVIITNLTKEEIILVGWDDTPDRPDPQNPLNWKPVKKWANILIISVISFLV